MSITTMFSGALPHKTAVTKPRTTGAGVWARAIAGITKAREVQAKRETNRFLARQPDRFLRDIGLNETEILDLRRRDTF